MLNIEILKFGSNYELPRIEHLRPFKCVLISELETTDNQKLEVCEWLLNAGCLYLMAWGKECSLWHDHMDEVHITAFNYQDIPGEHLVMTTWHPNESIRDVLRFAKYAATHGCTTLENLLILDLKNCSELSKSARTQKYKSLCVSL